MSPNRSGLLRFLCETWSENELISPSLGSTWLYLSGGFKEETKSALLTEGSVTDIPELRSMQQKANTGVKLFTVYSVQKDDVKMVIIHANDTAIIVNCVYYAATFIKDLT